MEIREIPINKIKVIENIRQRSIKEDLHELMSSIKQDGLMIPIGVKEVKDGYELIHGFRRMNACKKLGYKNINANIMFEKGQELDEKDFLILNTTENIQRSDIGIAELGRIVVYLKKVYSMTESEIASRLSVPSSRIKGSVNIYYKVPDKYKEKIGIFGSDNKERKGRIPMSVAQSLLSLRPKNKKDAEKVWDTVLQDEKMDANKLTKISNLVRSGIPINKAIEKYKDYRTISFKLVVDDIKLKQLEQSYDKTYTEIIKELLEREIKGIIA